MAIYPYAPKLQSFADVIDTGNFKKLQLHFLAKNYYPLKPEDYALEDLHIIVEFEEYVFWENGASDCNLIELDFKDDYLLPAVQELPDILFYKVIRYLKSSNLIYSKPSMQRYIERGINYLHDQVEKVESAAHLSEIKTDILNAIEELRQKLSGFLEEEVGDPYQKLTFNLKKDEVIAIFYWLQQVKIIPQNIPHQDLGLFIERHFEWKGGKNFKDVYKRLNAFDKVVNGSSSEIKALSRVRSSIEDLGRDLKILK